MSGRGSSATPDTDQRQHAGPEASDPGASVLVGRERELEDIGRLLSSAQAGHSGALLVRGGPGMGKTALLRRAGAIADPSMRVIAATGVQGGPARDYSGLRQLLGPFAEDARTLGGPQGRALRRALGLEQGDVDDSFLVGVGSLRAIAHAALVSPILLVVDDAHWLDRASIVALGFLARRLLAERVALLFAARDTGRPWLLEGVLECQLEALTGVEAGALLDATAPSISPTLRRRVIAEAHGNPLALVTLPGELVALGSDTMKSASPLPLPGRLESVFADRLRELPESAQTLALLAAAEATGAPPVIWRAAAAVGIDSASDGLQAASEILTFGSQVAFRHPLMRAAVYHAATDVQRRAAHQALAQSWNESDRDRKAWHRAAAAEGPSESIAHELVRAAEHAAAGTMNAADLLGRAAELTPPGTVRGERRLAAAAARLRARDPDRARETLAEAFPELRDEASLGHAHQISGEIWHGVGNPAMAATALVKAARLFARRNPDLARSVNAEAFEAAHETDRLAIDANVSDVLSLSTELAPGPSKVSYQDDLLRGFELIHSGRDAAGIAQLRAAITAPVQTAAADTDALRSLPIAWTAAAELYDDRALDALSQRWIRAAREQVPSGMIPVAVGRAPVADVHAGRFELAADGFLRASELASATGSAGPISGYAVAQVWLMAWQGRVGDVESRIAELSGELTLLRRGLGIRMLGLAQTLVSLATGDHRSAFQAALQAYERDSLFHLHTEPELVEAAVGYGRRDIAEAVSERLSQRAQLCGGSWCPGLSLRCRALLADGDDAEDFHVASLQLLRQSILLPQVGRGHLLYGEWLRAQGRRRDARAQLAIAHELFSSFGAEAFAERAERELVAAGGRPTRRQADPRPSLTGRERQVSRLAAEGLSNDEIAEQLFLSSSTVAYHLGKVFRKLDVASRSQLHRALSGD